MHSEKKKKLAHTRELNEGTLCNKHFFSLVPSHTGVFAIPGEWGHPSTMGGEIRGEKQQRRAVFYSLLSCC